MSNSLFHELAKSVKIRRWSQVKYIKSSAIVGEEFISFNQSPVGVVPAGKLP